MRRSVANHLNDLSRGNPALVTATARRWLQDPARIPPGPCGTDCGHSSSAAAPMRWRCSASPRPPSTIRNTGAEPARLAVDYIVHHHKANGSQTGKTFKLTTATLGPGESLELSREHSFRPITTRRYHPGPRGITLQVNGVLSARAGFDLLPVPASVPVDAAADHVEETTACPAEFPVRVRAGTR